jgi:hypothetical protein
VDRTYTCPNCNGKVTFYDKVCPHCGHNRPAASSAMTGLGCLVIVVIIIYFIVHNWTR